MIFKHILFPVDFLVQTRAVERDVEWLARRFGSRVTLLHAAQAPYGWSDVRGTAEFSGQTAGLFDCAAKENLPDCRIDVAEDRLTRIVARGRTARDIADQANEDDIDLVVMGTDGCGIAKRLLFGSILEEVLHEVPCPIWTRAARESDSLHNLDVTNILCLLEISEEAFPLLQFAKQIADAFGARISLLHSDPGAKPSKATRSGVVQYEDVQVGDGILSLQRQAGTDFSVFLTTEPVQEAVRHMALDRKADLVLIGRGTGHHWFTAGASGVIRHSPCPVLSYSPRLKCESGLTEQRLRVNAPVPPVKSSDKTVDYR